MDSDDGLMLNIFQSSNDDSVPSVSGGRRKNKWEERKQRRQNKRFSDRTDISDSRNDEVKNEKLKSNQTASFAYKEKSHKKYDKIEDNNLDVDFVKGKVNKSNKSNTAQKTQVISSLFRHNPEIPKLSAQPISKDIPKDEPLFSVQKFSDLPLSEHMISNLEKNLKMKTMTSVQKFAIPALLNGKDVFVKSKTGSGKTLCYALPIVHSLQKIQPKIERCDGPNALVLVPTRELALQSLNLLQKLVKPCQWVVPGYVVGGEKRKSEKARLRKGINILVATPGRLLDHIETTQCLELSKIRWIVLDEADRLLDMGFEKDVSSILQAIKDNVSSNTDFQTVLMSATLNKGIERLVEMFLNDPKFVNETEIQDVDFSFEDKLQNDISKDSALIATMPTQLQQFFIIVPVKMRLVTLAAFLQSKYQETRTLCKVIVFLSSRDSVDFHHSLFQAVLSKDDCKLFKLHGNMTQTERNDVFKEYSTAPAGILLCTDVAARGLDLPNVNWIVQYNTPGSAVDYIHRVGRTARIGTKGQALLFLTPSETGYLETLAEHNLRPKEILVGNVLSSLNANSEKKKDKNKAHGTIDRLSQDAATDLQLKFEEYVLSCPDNMKAAKKAYQSFIRSYATFPVNLKHIFHIKNLHLGHVAKAFALRDAPGGMFDQPKPSKKQKRKQTPITKQKRHKPVGEHDGNDRTCGPRPKKRKKH